MSRVSLCSAQTTSLGKRFQMVLSKKKKKKRFQMVALHVVDSICRISFPNRIFNFSFPTYAPGIFHVLIHNWAHLITLVGDSFWLVRNETVFLFWLEENLTHQVWQLKIIHLALIDSWANFFRIKKNKFSNKYINNINRGISRRLDDINLSCTGQFGWGVHPNWPVGSTSKCGRPSQVSISIIYKIFLFF